MRQAALEDPHDHGESRRLGSNRHEGRDRYRRSLVHVWRPHVERCGRDFERKTDAHEQDAEEDHRVRGGRGRKALGDVRDHRCPRASVDERHPIEDERAREPADQQVLRARFLGAKVGADETAHDVEGDRQQLETEKDRDQRGGRGQDHHPDHRGHDQDVELALAQSAPFQIGVRKRHGEDAQTREEHLEKEREVVAGREPVIRVAA